MVVNLPYVSLVFPVDKYDDRLLRCFSTFLTYFKYRKIDNWIVVGNLDEKEEYVISEYSHKYGIRNLHIIKSGCNKTYEEISKIGISSGFAHNEICYVVDFTTEFTKEFNPGVLINILNLNENIRSIRITGNNYKKTGDCGYKILNLTDRFSYDGNYLIKNCNGKDLIVDFKIDYIEYVDIQPDIQQNLNITESSNKTKNVSSIRSYSHSTNQQVAQIDKVFFKIIIPNYNNELYIKKCLDSILSQSFQNFKIVIVDDLSTDKSFDICKKYQKKHNDKIILKRMTYKGNEGGARNVGIMTNVECEYYMFIDGDDFLRDNNCLVKIYNKCVTNKSEVVFYKMVRYTNNKFFNMRIQKFKWDSSLAIGYSSACGKVVKSNIIEFFLENCDHASDTYQHLKVLNHHPSISEMNDKIYVYRKNKNSITLNGKYQQDTELFYYHLEKLKEVCQDEYVKRSIQYRIDLYKSGKIKR